MNFVRGTLIGVLALAGLLTAGCSILPTNGPWAPEIRSNEQGKTEDSLPYSLVNLNANVLNVLSEASPRLALTFPDRKQRAVIKFGVGDVVSVTIFEAAAGGLFIPVEAGVRPGNFITLPNQNVDTDGNIAVPYAGAIKADGRTPGEVQSDIVAALRNRAIEPQAVVSLVEQRTSLISVLGEVNSPNRFPANAAGERVLDAITRAGGPKGQGFDTWVMLERSGRRATMPFGALVYEPANNVLVQPDDTIYVYREPQQFLAFGASGQQGQFNFEAWRVSLAEAVGKSGGLNNDLADPASVFLYRGEPRDVAAKLGIDLIWLGIILGINLQTSFLTPPFGFALFYLRGIAPKEVSPASCTMMQATTTIEELTVGSIMSTKTAVSTPTSPPRAWE